MQREREKDNYKSREVKYLKECALALKKHLQHDLQIYEVCFERNVTSVSDKK